MSEPEVLHEWDACGDRLRLITDTFHPRLQMRTRIGDWIDREPTDYWLATLRGLAECAATVKALREERAEATRLLTSVVATIKYHAERGFETNPHRLAAPHANMKNCRQLLAKVMDRLASPSVPAEEEP